ncbi:hypothetical protein VNO78_32966 [Psophocarpus tetragonolobus]|uniref:Plastocyanin-like domain-containing protein n=1 Tax=Psophocarpus tetragonolobus TaxID=3891 RepID=A0AAN9NXI6_PSOTE
MVESSPGGSRIIFDYLVHDVSDVFLQAKVGDIYIANENWDFILCEGYIPLCFLPNRNRSPDKLTWALNTSCQFSDHLAYHLIDGSYFEGSQTTWKRIWLWEGPQQVNHVSILSCHNAPLIRSKSCVGSPHNEWVKVNVDTYLICYPNTAGYGGVIQNTLRHTSIALNQELFFAIANHKMIVVVTNAAYTKSFTTNVLMIGPDQKINVLVTANQTPGRYYMASRAYQTATNAA